MNTVPMMSLGGPAGAPKCSRFEQLIKTLVGRKVSREPPTPPLLPSPEILITRSPSEHTLIKNDRITSSTLSLNSVQQKLWSVVPLLATRHTDGGSSASLYQTKSSPLAHHSGGLKKCETVLALSRSSSNLEPIKPQNRLRHSSSTSTCSRCSSLLSLAANGSRYSLNLSNGGFIPVGSGDRLAVPPPRTPSPTTTTPPSPQVATVACKLCLGEVTADKSTKITQCGCLFCTEVCFRFFFIFIFIILQSCQLN